MVELAVHKLISLGASTHHWDTNEKPDLEHDQNLRNLLDHCRARNIKLNKKKFHLKCSEVSFTRHAVSKASVLKYFSKSDPNEG